MKTLLLKQKLIRFLPLFLIIFLIWLLYKGLNIKTTERDLVEEVPFPEFALLDFRQKNNSEAVSLQHLKGHVSIVHVWASWCGICVKEHEEWVKIKDKWSDYPIVGIVYRDNPQRVLDIIKHKGDPFTYLLHDDSGDLGLEIGIVGTPESFIVDENGIIRFHHLGPLTMSLFENTFVPILKKIEGEEV